VLNIEPKNIVLLIGTNDIGRGLPLSMTLDDVEKIIKKTKERCPNVNLIIEAVYPINEKMRDRFEKRNNIKIDEMNKEYIKLCKKYNCILLDFTDQLKDTDGNLKQEYTYDGLHVNAKAYKIIAENVIPFLKK
jgi:lysophospholipase L1-like esterase